jgi:hypothetical protein
MATTLLKLGIGDGSDEYVEVEVDRRDLEGVHLASDDGEGAVRAPYSLAASLGRVMPAINTILNRLRSADQAPDEIGIELGLTIGGETGLIFTKGTAEATFAITVTWRKPTAAPEQPAGLT